MSRDSDIELAFRPVGNRDIAPGWNMVEAKGSLVWPVLEPHAGQSAGWLTTDQVIGQIRGGIGEDYELVVAR
jgi:hypothetical protein